MLQIERDMAAREGLKRLLAAADATVAGHRRDLRAVTARLKRDRTKRP